MSKNTINTIGAFVFMFGLVILNRWFTISAIKPLDAVWLLAIGFALSFIARSGNLRYLAVVIFIFGFVLTQPNIIRNIPQLLEYPSLIRYSGWIMVGGYMVLSFSGR